MKLSPAQKAAILAAEADGKIMANPITGRPSITTAKVLAERGLVTMKTWNVGGATSRRYRDADMWTGSATRPRPTERAWSATLTEAGWKLHKELTEAAKGGGGAAS